MNIEDRLLKIFFDSIKDYEPFTAEEEYENFQLYKRTKDAEQRKKLILHNQRLVIAIAKKYFKYTGVSKLDIISEGILGLLKSIDYFEPDSKNKFSTYAYFWIKSYIEAFINKNKYIVKIPIHIINFKIKVFSYIRKFYLKNKRKPTAVEMAEHFNISNEEFLQTFNVVTGEYSLSYKFNEDSEDFINYLNLNSFSSFYVDNEKKEQLDGIKLLLDGLKKEYKQAIILRFGLDGSGFKTLEEVGNIMHFTREGIRLLINKGMKIILKKCNIEEKRNMDDLKKFIRDVPDFPQKGIIFKDITTLLKDPAAFKKAIDEMQNQISEIEFDKIAVIESRGFIFGSVIAYNLGKPLILIRKAGKLPADTIKETYSLEYGEDTLEIHRDAISNGDKFIIIDDLLATGGTVAAVKNMLEKNGAIVSAFLFLIELEFLKGRDKLIGTNILSLIKY